MKKHRSKPYLPTNSPDRLNEAIANGKTEEKSLRN
jgi:hypothetical protein